MSTLDDLHQVLAAHADEAVSAGVSPTERASAVRGRIRVVRRRRQAATALAAVAVVAAGAALWIPGREGPSPVDRPSIGGKVVPRTMTSLGYGYEFDRAASGDGSASLRLAASTTPRLVTWVARGDVELQTTFDDASLGRQPAERMTAGTFTDFQIVTEDAQRLRLTGSGEVGLAVYDLATRAPGVTQHGVTWRTDVGSYQLLQAGTGVPGQTRVSGTVTLPLQQADPDPRLSLRYLCSGAATGATVHLLLAGQEVVAGGCQSGAGDDRPWDAAIASGSFDDIDPDDYGRPGQTIPYEARLTTGSALDGPAPVGDDAQIGVGLYLDLPAGGRVGTNEVASLVEENGHTYRLLRIARSERGERSLRTTVTARRTPLLVRAVTSDALPGYTRILGDGQEIARLGDAAGGSSQSTAALLLEASADLEVRVREAGPRTVLGFATYVRND